MEGVRLGSLTARWLQGYFTTLSPVTLNCRFDKDCLTVSRAASLSKDLTSEHKVGLLMLRRGIGMVVLLGVISGSLAFSPGDDAMDMLSSSSLLI